MKIIVLEGIDASGKETQAKMLAKALRDKGYFVAEEAFPRYHTHVGIMIKRWLTDDQYSLSDQAAHLLYEVDRYDFQDDIRQLEEVFDFLILDRYMLSNLAFCMAKGMDIDFIKMVQSKLRKPDVTFVMDITAETAINRKVGLKDKHELDTSLLNRARAAYNALVDADEDMLVFKIDANGTPEEIHSEVMSHVELMFIDRGVVNG